MFGQVANNDNGFQEVSPAQHIAELNILDHDIAELLSLASQAIDLLSKDNYDTPNPNLDNVQSQFLDISSRYASKLSNIEVKMRRKVNALEEADRIDRGTRYDADRATLMSEDQTSKRPGGGPLDSSWLNARAKDSVGQGLKREVLDDVKKFLKNSNIDVPEMSEDGMQVDSGND